MPAVVFFGVKPARALHQRVIEMVRFGASPMANREKMLRGFFLKAVYDLPTTKVLIENLKTSPSLRRLCGWEYKRQLPAEAAFSRGFKEFAAQKLLALMHDVLVSENYKEKVVGHAGMDATAITGRETELEQASKIGSSFVI